MRYAALLRGINVGGHAKLSMPALRELLASAGYAGVTTYIQSGNVVFTSEDDDPERLARDIERRIAGDLGLNVTVLIRTGEELAAVVASNPFPDAVSAPSTLHVSFLSATPSAEQIATIDRQRFEPDEFGVGDRVIYLHYPNGAGRAKITNELWERRFALRATSRNWNTVNKLLAMVNV